MIASRWIQSITSSLPAISIPSPEKIKNTFSQLRKGIYETAEQGKAFAQTVYQSKYVCDLTYQYLLQGWQGFSRMIDPNIGTAFIRSTNIRQILRQSLPNNIIWYMGPVLFYEVVSQRVFGEENEYWRQMLVSSMFSIYFLRLYLHKNIDNFAYNLCITEATLNDNPLVIHDKICDCRQTAKIRANLASGFYFLANAKTVEVIAFFLGKPVGLFFRTLLYGQSLMEYKLSAIGMCTKHRYEVLAKNNAYAVGMGLSLILPLELSYFVLDMLFQYTLGVKIDQPLIILWWLKISGSLIYDAVFCALYQHYIMVALLIDKPLPGETVGWDFFYYSRLVMELTMRQTWDAIYPILNQPEIKTNACNYWEKLINFPPARLMRDFMVEGYFSSFDDFMQRPAIKLYFDFHGKKFQQIIEWIMEQRSNNYMKSVANLSGYVPNFLVSPSEKKMLGFLFEDKLENILTKLNLLINQILNYEKIKKLDPHACNVNDTPISIKSIIKDDYLNNLEKLDSSIIEDFEMMLDQSPPISHLQKHGLFSGARATTLSSSQIALINKKNA